MLIALLILLSGIFFLPVISGKGVLAFNKQEVTRIYSTRLYKFSPIWDVEVVVWPPQTERLQAVAAKGIAVPAAVIE